MEKKWFVARVKVVGPHKEYLYPLTRLFATMQEAETERLRVVTMEEYAGQDLQVRYNEKKPKKVKRRLSSSLRRDRR